VSKEFIPALVSNPGDLTGEQQGFRFQALVCCGCHHSCLPLQVPFGKVAGYVCASYSVRA
jgi:hypothetical protein